MTNFERLLDLPLREVLKEFDREEAAKTALASGFSDLMLCDGSSKACKICDSISSSCSGVCEAWFDSESDSDANYNEDVWHDVAEEDPPTLDTTIEYLVLISGAELPTTLVFDGEHWLDFNANHYNVKYWRPMPKLPEEVMKNAD